MQISLFFVDKRHFTTNDDDDTDDYDDYDDVWSETDDDDTDDDARDEEKRRAVFREKKQTTTYTRRGRGSTGRRFFFFFLNEYYYGRADDGDGDGADGDAGWSVDVVRDDVGVAVGDWTRCAGAERGGAGVGVARRLERGAAAGERRRERYARRGVRGGGCGDPG